MNHHHHNSYSIRVLTTINVRERLCAAFSTKISSLKEKKSIKAKTY